MKIFRVGFSGTRFGMQPAQMLGIERALVGIIEWVHFLNQDVYIHHGDCVGADEEFHHMARRLGVDGIVIHPPTKNEHRAYCEGDEMREPFPHLVRNQHIVFESDVMLTAPPTDIEQVRGGTWSTTRLARECHKLWRVVLPSGASVPGPSIRNDVSS